MKTQQNTVELDVLEALLQLLQLEGALTGLTNTQILKVVEETFGVKTNQEAINLLYEGEILNEIIIY